jgi:hypothetical protein
MTTSRSLNFTGRVKIPHDRVSIRLIKSLDGIRLSAAVDLTGISLQEPFVVRIDVYRQSYRETVEASRVSDSVAEFNALISEFVPPELMLCVIKVLSTNDSGRGKILAWAERVRPTLEGSGSGGSGLLPTTTADLGQLIWKLDVSEDVPTLLINSAIDGPLEFARDPRFQWIIMPELLRGICRWLSTRLEDVGEEIDPTAALWLGLLKDLGLKVSDQTAEEDIDDWIELAVMQFAEKNRFVERLNQSFDSMESA